MNPTPYLPRGQVLQSCYRCGITREHGAGAAVCVSCEIELDPVRLEAAAVDLGGPLTGPLTGLHLAAFREALAAPAAWPQRFVA